MTTTCAPEFLTITAIVRALKQPPSAWEGNCYAIACAIVKAGLVEGRAVYGHWLGEVADHGYWAGQHRRPFQRHGWIILPDGKILDPTRWSFEGVKPYLWLNEDDGTYDEGGDSFRSVMVRPCPGNNDACPDGVQRYVRLELKRPEQVRLHQVSGGILYPSYKQKRLTLSQLFWIANLPYAKLYPFARPIYLALEAVGQRVAVPLDNWERAQHEE